MFQRWPDIESLGNVVKAARRCGGTSLVVTYRPKIKLHGTNAAVRVAADGAVTAQSRTRDITPDDDNYGFAAWVEGKADSFRWLAKGQEAIFYGEWCGHGINDGTAVQQIGRKVFAIFEGPAHRGDVLRVCHHIDFYGPERTVNLLDDADVAAFAAEVNAAVAVVEAEDPWVLENFGVSGVGEGLVYYALNDVPAAVRMFKAKGEKHRVNKTKTAAAVDEEVLATKGAFVSKYVTDARLSQALAEVCGGTFDKTKTGMVLAWVCRDVEKESHDDRPLPWKELSAAVAGETKRRLFADIS